MGCTQSDFGTRSGGGGKGLEKIPNGNVKRRASEYELRRRQSSTSGNFKIDDEGSISMVLSSGASSSGSNGGKVAAPPRRYSTAPAATTSARRPSDGSNLVRAKSDGQSLSKKPSERRMSFGNPTKCKRCDESVGKTEEAKDSKGLIFHVACLKCSTCGVKLTARECVSTSAIRMTSSQYCQQGQELFCQQHAPTVENARRKNSIKGQAIDKRAVEGDELNQLGSSRRDLNEKAKEVLEETGGFSAELKCGRCGGVITKNHKITVSGMLRYHEVCPSKDELAKADKSVKWFLERLPDRLAAILTCDAVTKKPHTFLYARDNASYKDALKQSLASKRVSVVFVPDAGERDQIPKNFVVPTERQFDVNLRGFSLGNFTFDALENEPKQVPSVGEKKLTVIKQAIATGVFMKMEALYFYDETNKETPVYAEKLILSFEKISGGDADASKARNGLNGSPNINKLGDALVESAGGNIALPKPKNSTRTLERFDSSGPQEVRMPSTPPAERFATSTSSSPSKRQSILVDDSPLPTPPVAAKPAMAAASNLPGGKPPPLPKNKPNVQPKDMDVV